MAHYKRPRTSQDGFSLATVVLIALAVILGSIAMIDRATSGWLGSLFVGQSREARDAAEIGLMRVVSQLNRSRNRRLLVNAELMNNSTTASQIEANSHLISRCTTLTPDLSGSATENPKGELGTGIITGVRRDIDPAPRTTSGTTRSFRIVGFSQPSSSREFNADYTANQGFGIRIGHGATPAQPGEISITVQGIVRRGETTIASTTITETLEVVPKCCGNSFNGANNAFGNDTRACDWPPLSTLTATSKNTPPGYLSASGASVSFNAENDGSPLSYVLCITEGCQSASTLNSNTGTTVKEESTLEIKDEEFDKFKVISNPSLNGSDTIDCEGTSTDPACNITLTDLHKTTNGTTEPYSLNSNTLTLDTGDIPAWPDEFKKICSITTAPLDSGAVHCNINRLDFGANNLTIDIKTSPSKPLRFYFPNLQTGTTKTINQRNNGSFTHSPDPDDGKITDLMMLGRFTCAPGQSQVVDLGNGTNQAFKLFAYFRCGTVNIGGNEGYDGVLWADKIIANGNVNFNAPTNAISDILSFIDWETPMVDWVARAIRSVRLF